MSLAVALVACALCGGVAGWMLRDHAAGGDARARAGTPAPAGDAVRSTATDIARRTPAPGDDLGRESARARRDSAYLRNLLERYAAEPEGDRKGALLAALQATANDAVLATALEMAGHPDPGTRRDGLALLAAFPLDRTEVRDSLVGQLRDERDPAMQARLLEMLAPVPVAREDAAPLLAQVARLRDADDPRVRAAAVRQTAQWDRTPAAEPALHRALMDPDPQVRLAALSGVYLSGARSDRLRDALLAAASDPRADHQARQAAVMALQHFTLDRAEYAVYREAAEAASTEHAH